MKIMQGLFKGGFGLLLLLLTACGGGGSGSGSGSVSPPSQTITGVVRASQADIDAGTFARNETGLGSLRMLAAWIGLAIPPVQAAVSGLVPVLGATVELVRLDAAGNPIATLATTTSSLVDGSYSFTTTVVPADATLAVRVVGQATTMRAIVTGSQVDVTPISEAVTQTVVAAGPLTNFVPSEVAVLDELVAGMQVDVTTQPFANAVATLRSAAGPVLPDLATGMAGPGVVKTIDRRSFQLIDLSLGLGDPLTRQTVTGPDRQAGLTAGNLTGNGYFGQLGLVQGQSFGSANPKGFVATHDLSRVGAPFLIESPLSSIRHIATTTNQLVVENGAGGSTGGFVRRDASLLAFPLDAGDNAGLVRTGLRFMLMRDFGPGSGSNLDPSLLDQTVSGSRTSYNYVALEQRLSGASAAPFDSGGTAPGNAYAVVVRDGTITFDARDTFTRLSPPGASTSIGYGQLGVGPVGTLNPSQPTIESSRVAIALDAPMTPPQVQSFPPSAMPDKALDGYFTVFADGSVQLLDTSGFFTEVLSGGATTSGDLLVLYNSRNLFPRTLDVLANDHGNALSITRIVTAPGLGQATIRRDTQGRGTDIIYTTTATVPSAAADSLTYEIQDQAGTLAQATVTLDFLPYNGPTAANADSFIVPAGSAQTTLAVLANDAAAIGDALCVAAITLPPTPPATAAISADRASILFTPPATGVSDTLSYSLGRFADASHSSCTDLGLVATVSIDLTTPVSTPVAADDTIPVTLNDSALHALALAGRQATSTDAVALQGSAALSGTYNVVEYAVDMTPSPLVGQTTVLIGSSYRYGTVTLDGLGGLGGGSLILKRATLDLAGATASTPSPALAVIPAPATPDQPDPATSGYTVDTLGHVQMTVVIAGGETLAGRGFVTPDGDLVALAVETSEAVTGRVGRGLLLLSRQ